MINHEDILFDELHGKFRIKNKTDKLCSLTGDKSVYFLTYNALNRKGWSVADSASDVSINIRKNKTDFTWHVRKTNFEKEAHSIKEMLDILK